MPANSPAVNTTQWLVVLCSCPDREAARQIAHTLVADRLTACVNLLPEVQSIYHWQGKIETSAEVLLLIKCHAQDLADLTGRLLQLHPYEVPEVLALPVLDGAPHYLEWLAGCRRPVGERGTSGNQPLKENG